ncbi:MAG: hypothetical protein H4O13_09770 [Xanthomonadales bacterium]|nr:hypothetical protein [Xanthomonadales bacterium]
MNRTLQNRLQALEVLAARVRSADTAEARAASEALRELLQAHDVDGALAASLEAARSIAERAVAVVDLLELCSEAERREFMNKLADANGRPRSLT